MSLLRLTATVIALVLTMTAVAAAGTLSVEQVFPPAHVVTAAADTPIVARFSADVDPATVGPASLFVFGKFTGTVTGTIDVAGSFVRFLPDQPLSPGDWVTVRLTRAVGGLGGETLANGHVWNFWTASAPAGMTFTNEGELDPGSIPYGAHGGDIDHDGDLDLVVPNEGSNDIAVYLNDGSGGFGPRTTYAAGSVPSPIEAADFDADGHVDVVVGNTFSEDVSVYMGRGDGTFEAQVRHPTGFDPRGIAPLDLDGDGDLDLLVTNRDSSDVSLLGNSGTGAFGPEKRLNAPGSGETAAVATDHNGDGREDLIVGYHGSNEVRVFLRSGNGFVQSSQASAGGSVWQMAVGDLNADGLADAVTANSSSSSAGVLLATAPGVLAPAVTYGSGSFPIAIDLGDLDGDGDLDMVVSNFGSGDYTIWENDGSGTFINRRELDAIVSGSCTVLHDRDGDGDLDITALDENADRIFLYRND